MPRRKAAVALVETPTTAETPATDTTPPATEQLRPWPADVVERWPLARIRPYPRNVLIHTPEQVRQIADSMVRFGVTTPLLVDEDGVLIFGHGRREAAALLGYTELPVSIARGWSEDDKRAYRIVDNQLARNSEWDMPALRAEIGHLQIGNFPMPLLGFPLTHEVFSDPEGTPDSVAFPNANLADLDKGALLKLISVTIAEPTHVVERGDHYILGGRHHLLCASPVADWPRWVPLLVEGSLFCPYPGVFVPFSTKAETHVLIMVQPDTYVSGHILDRYSEIKSDDDIIKVEIAT